MKKYFKKINNHLDIFIILGIMIIILAFWYEFKLREDFDNKIYKNYPFIISNISCKNDNYSLIKNNNNYLFKTGEYSFNLFVTKYPNIKKYCNNCGEKTSKIAVYELKDLKCNQCEKKNKLSYKFCSDCGNKLENKKYEKIKNLDKYYEDVNHLKKKQKINIKYYVIGFLILLISGLICIFRNIKTNF